MWLPCCQPQCGRCQGHRAAPSRSNVLACRPTAACWYSRSWWGGNGAGWSVMQHRVAVIDSRKNQAACKRVLGSASVDVVCGGSRARGNCMIALRLTHDYRKSGDDREWRRELASNLPPASRHPRRILTSMMTPLSAVWLCPWRALRTCLDSVGVHSAYTTAWRRWYKRREWTGRQLCCRRASLGGAECHRRIDGIGRHGTRWRQRLGFVVCTTILNVRIKNWTFPNHINADDAAPTEPVCLRGTPPPPGGGASCCNLKELLTTRTNTHAMRQRWSNRKCFEQLWYRATSSNKGWPHYLTMRQEETTSHTTRARLCGLSRLIAAAAAAAAPTHWRHYETGNEAAQIAMTANAPKGRKRKQTPKTLQIAMCARVCLRWRVVCVSKETLFLR